MGVGDFAIVKDSYKGKEVSYYVEKKQQPYARGVFGNTPEMMDFFSKKLNVEYPWPKYAQMVGRDYVSGAMENTSAAGAAAADSQASSVATAAADGQASPLPASSRAPGIDAGFFKSYAQHIKAQRSILCKTMLIQPATST
jgi:hypothetical protein